MYQLYVMLQNLLLREFAVVSKEEARKNRYYGIGGWLLVFCLLTVIGVLGAIYDLMVPPDQLYLSSLGADATAYRSNQIVTLLFGALVLLPTFLKHRLAPKIWIGSMWAGSLYAFASLFSARPPAMPGSGFALAITVAISILLTWYFVNSKRVNVTFLHRVPVGQTDGGFDDLGRRHKKLASGTSTGEKFFWFFAAVFALIIGIWVLSFIFGNR